MGRKKASVVLSVGESQTDKVTVPPEVIWRMTYDERVASRSVRAAWVALGPVAVGKMASMLFSAIDTRRAFMAKMGVATWRQTGLPKLTVIVDEGIDLGDLRDKIVWQGGVVGVVLAVIGPGEEGL